MSETFTLKFEYNGQPHILYVQTLHQQFKTVYQTVVADQEIIFEPDEEGFVRAVATKPLHNQIQKLDVGLVHHIASLIVDHLGVH
ncbi:hypothetical protein SAMN05660909_03368 [Chitinophaga terrae (ex Kim and Jung 2007)]|jgi:hypothetical protein|uniref:Uncharacterized protein n=1 Tax=Chitinophaga terrae (ex Kim and Jung 2007) TaxID=408074 RepID=A0A1H4DXC1_9BACT|nr:hypothetical protein [Chitinophaga terrae (ex Kim and Jung 2007)]MDQ0104972.1 hypothetical protein [Chitinophaga terrae (ex Kim and Jung 2007)]GEP91300.1 hypothetical protein CTE07_29450 [Chitinophaga terrae (ex Kim and Jung 2007)]SEA77227.1 hypothetical protein SAMN05660909_03368 [Chitinophaga terrae (ex Kim and Jung 2007)]